jgi:hypothetical protein
LRANKDIPSTLLKLAHRPGMILLEGLLKKADDEQLESAVYV